MRVVLLLLLCLLGWPAFTNAQGVTGEREIFHLGGDGSDGAFTYNGECDPDCTGDICNGGDCSSGSPPCTCSLIGASYLLHTAGDNPLNPTAVVKNYSSFTLSDGTLTVGTLGLSGTVLVLRVNGDLTLTAGTIDLKGKGGAGASGGACLSSTAGVAGGPNTMNLGGAAGASGTNNGTTGVPSLWSGSISGLSPFFLFPFLVGSGGGTAPVTGQTPPQPVNIWFPSVGATGGGGGGCGASCSGTVGAGGRGGGMIRMEAAGTYDCVGATIDVRGDNGAAGGGGGGGGGGVHALAWRIGTNTCTYSIDGGTGNLSPPTNCGHGAAGGDGSTIVESVPR